MLKIIEISFKWRLAYYVSVFRCYYYYYFFFISYNLFFIFYCFVLLCLKNASVIEPRLKLILVFCESFGRTQSDHLRHEVLWCCTAFAYPRVLGIRMQWQWIALFCTHSRDTAFGVFLFHMGFANFFCLLWLSGTWSMLRLILPDPNILSLDLMLILQQFI